MSRSTFIGLRFNSSDLPTDICVKIVHDGAWFYTFDMASYQFLDFILRKFPDMSKVLVTVPRVTKDVSSQPVVSVFDDGGSVISSVKLAIIINDYCQKYGVVDGDSRVPDVVRYIVLHLSDKQRSLLDMFKFTR